MGKKWLALGALGLALVINPYLACSESSESDFTYSEADMKLATLGTWQGTAEVDGVTSEFSLSLEQASSRSQPLSVAAPKLQPQCASRSFIKPAGACLAATTMLVLGTLSSENPAFNGAVDGELVGYRSLETVQLHLRLDSGAELSGQIRDQALSEGSVQNVAPPGSFFLSRP